jgi:hypothetical protein
MLRRIPIALAVFIVFAGQAAAEKKVEKLKLEELPKEVRDAAVGQAPEYKWRIWRYRDEDAATNEEWYDLHGEKTQDPNIYLTPEGVDMIILPTGYIQEHKVQGKTENVPQNVRDFLKQRVPGWSFSHVEEIRVGGKKEVDIYRLLISDDKDLEGESATLVDIDAEAKTLTRARK